MPKSCQRGFSIVEVLVASGIMAVIAMGFASYMTNQNKEFKALAETLSSQDLTKSMIGALAKGDVCHYILSTKTFNANEVVAGNQQIIDIGTQPLYATMMGPGVPGPAFIKKGDKASNYTSSLVIDKIQFKVMTGVINGAVGSFVGQWEAHYDRSKSVRNVKPSIATATIKATIDGSGNATTISCLGSGTSGSGTEGHLAKWASMSELGDSIVFQDSINDRIGIGTTTPTQKLSVNGVLSAGKVQLIDEAVIDDNCTPNGIISRTATNKLLICQSGKWKSGMAGGKQLQSDLSTIYANSKTVMDSGNYYEQQYRIDGGMNLSAYTASGSWQSKCNISSGSCNLGGGTGVYQNCVGGCTTYSIMPSGLHILKRTDGTGIAGGSFTLKSEVRPWVE